MVSARIAEIVLRDEQAVIPIGAYNPLYDVTLSLPPWSGARGPCAFSSRGCRQTSARPCGTVQQPIFTIPQIRNQTQQFGASNQTLFAAKSHT
jgi:hypothetical protein